MNNPIAGLKGFFANTGRALSAEGKIAGRAIMAAGSAAKSASRASYYMAAAAGAAGGAGYGYANSRPGHRAGAMLRGAAMGAGIGVGAQAGYAGYRAAAGSFAGFGSRARGLYGTAAADFRSARGAMGDLAAWGNYRARGMASEYFGSGQMSMNFASPYAAASPAATASQMSLF